MSWKDQIDKAAAERERRRLEIEQANRSRKKREEELDEERKLKRENEKRERKLQGLARRFRCCTCGQGSEEPGTRKKTTYIHDPMGWGNHEYTDIYEVWGRPGDMSKCLICGNWVHNTGECSHFGVCRNCWKRLGTERVLRMLNK